MSAIFGVLGAASKDELELMAARLSHKGKFAYIWSPDTDIWLGEIRNSPRQSSEPENTAFSGQLYINWGEIPEAADYDALDRDLHQRRFVTDALHRDGIHYADSLDGYFGVASWDSVKRQLLLGTDRVNYENIYYTRTSERFVFASEYKAMLALEDVDARPDPDVLQYSIASFLPNYDSTLCGGISRVHYGHTLMVSRDGEQQHQFFRPECRPEPGNMSQFAEGLRNVLLTELTQLLGHHERIAITLSGGLDSAGLLGMMRHLFPDKTIASYTIGTGDGDPEIIGARVGAAYCGTEHHEYQFQPDSLIVDLPKIIWLSEEFASREESILQYQLQSLILGQEKVLTAGHGADMDFGGMPRHRLVRLAEILPFVGKGLTELYQQTQTGLLPETAIGKVFSHLVYRGKNVEPPRLSGSAGPPRIREPSGLDDMLLHTVGAFHPHHYHSSIYSLEPLEVVMPFMSSAVIDYSTKIPTRFKVGLLQQKVVLRKALAPFIPKEIYNRGKAIQRVKRDSALSDAIDVLASQLLSSEDVKSRQLIDPCYVSKVRQRPKSGIYSGDQLSRLWMLISSELWCRTFVDNRGAPYGFS
ncbi:MAG: asparagine synthase-related protein, partial [Woeseiaceae bacterium]|nr:asparagine synthase-related protein [Woeseiaceae bacterium]